MQQFHTPQFITVEDRVIGPFTVKQALWLGAGVALVVGFNMVFSRGIAILLSFPIVAVVLALAFVKIGERPFPVVLKNALFYFFRPRIYIWKKDAPKPLGAERETESATPKTGKEVKRIPNLTESKLSDLAWSLDVKERQQKN